ncbi:hypothetical protein [Tenacibaculum agarivorans]|uniref:hypothetical protein n=1 Tax=Tenacibaculum agarivorans TaxID=1908389 RepID=UPI000A6DDF7A|nr:hypothetical protein [Tenacibaculum agarivorans]
MKKSILNLGNVLSKDEQSNVHGSIQLIQIAECSSVCRTAKSGTRCVSGGTHCPGECDGRGGWYNY